MTCPVCKEYSSAFRWITLAMGLHACPNCGTVNYPRAIVQEAERKGREETDAPSTLCQHLRLNEDGICRTCGTDCRGLPS
jgi:hypothetical protein